MKSFYGYVHNFHNYSLIQLNKKKYQSIIVAVNKFDIYMFNIIF